MTLEVGQKVRIKTYDQMLYDFGEFGRIKHSIGFMSSMENHCGKLVTIRKIRKSFSYDYVYRLEEIGHNWVEEFFDIKEDLTDKVMDVLRGIR